MPRNATSPSARSSKRWKARGCEVYVLDKPVDLAVRRDCWPPGMVMFLEVKTGNEKVREGVQADAIASAGIAVVRTPMEAVNAVWNVKYA